MATEKTKHDEPALPDYAPMMADYHRAYASELKAIIGDLPLGPDARIVDFACGDGSYARWLADHVGATGQVLALDISRAFLELARRTSSGHPCADRILFLQADLEQVPIDPGSVDLAWCAQSLYSLPDPEQALRRMANSVRPGGHVAVLENDELHHILLPWPIELELAVKRAEWDAFLESSERPRKYYIGRELRRLFHVAGLERTRAHGIVFTRQAPLDKAARGFLAGHLDDLHARAAPRIDSSLREAFDRLCGPRSGDYLLDQPDLTVSCVNHVVVGIRPGSPP